MAVHTYDVDDVVTIFQMHPRKGLMMEGEATVRKRISDVDEQYLVEFDTEPGETYERFVDVQGQDGPAHYVREFNKKLGYKAA